MKRYVFLLGTRMGEWEQLTPAEQDEVYAAHERFHAWTDERGYLRISGAPLEETPMATTVRHIDGRREVSDGPFVETTEIVVGYYDVELPDLDAAIEAAALLPHRYAVEIRPVEDLSGT